jgi:SagB-type dehydrogenase family enzyme
MDLFVVAGQSGVQQLDAAVYHYHPQRHHLVAGAEGDLRHAVAQAALGQMWMATAPANVVITAEYRRATRKYGNRGVRYAMIEAGHIGQNLFLQAEALGLKAGIVGAFDDKKLAERLSLPAAYEPLLVMPVGYAV